MKKIVVLLWFGASRGFKLSVGAFICPTEPYIDASGWKQHIEHFDSARSSSLTSH